MDLCVFPEEMKNAGARLFRRLRQGYSLRDFAHRPCRGTNNQFWPKKNGALHLTARELLVFLLCGIALAKINTPESFILSGINTLAMDFGRF